MEQTLWKISLKDRAKQALPVDLSAGVDAFDVSPCGNYLAAGTLKDTMFRLLDARTGQELAHIREAVYGPNGCRFSKDGQKILFASWDKSMKLWTPITADVRATDKQTYVISCYDFSPDNRYIIAGLWVGYLRMWDAETFQQCRQLEWHKAAVTGCRYSSDGKRIVSSSEDKTLKTWDAESGKLIRTFSGHTDKIATCGFSPDGKQIVSGSADGTMKIWDAESGEILRELSDAFPSSDSLSGSNPNVTEFYNRDILACDYSPDGNYIVSLVNMRRSMMMTSRYHVQALFSPQQNRSEISVIKIWDANTGEPLNSYSGYKLFRFAPDNSGLLAIAEL